MTDSRHVDQAVAELRAIADPEPSHAWKQMTHFIVLACTHPGVLTVLAVAAQAVAPILVPLRELAGRARASLPESGGHALAVRAGTLGSRPAG
jgi:hypothetical protein